MSQTKIRSPLMPKTVGKTKKKPSSVKPLVEIEKHDFIEMRSETLPSRTVLASDREGRINYTLDMVVHDLITQGHVSASRAAYMLKSPEMKEHVGRICDEMARRRKESTEPKTIVRPHTSVPTHLYQAHGPNQHGAGTAYNSAPSSDHALASTSSPSTSAPADNLSAPPVNKKIPLKKKVIRPDTALPSIRVIAEPTQSKASKGSELSKKSNAGHGQDGSVPVIRKKSLVKTNKVVKKDNPDSGVEQRPSTPRNKPMSILKSNATEAQIQNGILQDIPSTSQLNQIFNFPPPFEPYNTDATAYRTRVDLTGFTNDNISLDLDGRRLIVVAFRPKDRTAHARKITEIVDIPDNVDLENLKIGRRLDGALIVEEIVNI